MFQEVDQIQEKTEDSESGMSHGNAGLADLHKPRTLGYHRKDTMLCADYYEDLLESILPITEVNALSPKCRFLISRYSENCPGLANNINGSCFYVRSITTVMRFDYLAYTEACKWMCYLFRLLFFDN